MHPLEALGLARDADERAVKRAYAQRLRTTRPDEDPEGFQKLHEAYRAALSYLRWREEHPDEGDFWDDEDEEPGEASESPAEPDAPAMSPAEFEALIGNPRYRPDEPMAVPNPKEAAPQAPPVYERGQEQAEPFRLDFGAFVDGLFARAEARDERGFRAFLAEETGSWPIGVREAVGTRLLDHLDQDDAPLSPEQLEAVIDVFGFDDVLSEVDPLALAELRERVAYRREERERSGRVGFLLDPRNRDELCRVMGQPEHGSHPGFVTRMILGLLTGANAYRRALVLRPVPFLNRWVMSFLRDIDYGRLDVIARHVDARALDFWQWAETRREANRGVRFAALILGLIIGIGYVLKDAPDTPSTRYTSRPKRTVLQDADRRQVDKFGERIRHANRAERAEGLEEYRRLLPELPAPPWSPGMEEIVALAHYNFAAILSELSRPAEAREGYQEVDRLVGRSFHRPVQLIVAYALVNLGYQLADGGSDREALAPFQQVVVRYGHIKTDTFDFQIAKALGGRAAAFTRLGEADEARHALDDLLRRFGDRETGEIGELVKKARERRAALDGPEPPAGAAPSEGMPPPPVRREGNP